MISKSKIKLIRSLEQKKYRLETGLFIAEGDKTVSDLLGSTPCKMLAATKEWHYNHQDLKIEECIEVTQEELSKISLQQHPQDVIAVFKQFDIKEYFPVEEELTLMLDGVQDPGNLGTIIRISDWYGIGHILCSYSTVDVYNPKVVQATMGSISRVKVEYVDLVKVLSQIPENFPVYGTLLDGKDIYKQTLTKGGLIIMGNEAAGISPEIRNKVTVRLLLPHYPENRHTVESLNVAVATSITCAEFRRRVRI